MARGGKALGVVMSQEELESLVLSGALTVSGAQTFSGNLHASGALAVAGSGAFAGALIASGTFAAQSTSVFTGNVHVTGAVAIEGSGAITGTFTASDAFTAVGTTLLQGATNIGATAGVIVGFHGATGSAKANVVAALTTTAALLISGAYAYETGAQADNLIAAVNSILTLLKNKGLMATA